MKRYSDLDIYGRLTLRGKFSDQLATDGGFYSRGFGELAYKSDLGQAAESPTKFYGISVKLTDNSQRFKGINVVAFNTNDFYVHRQHSRDDEVIVTLDGAVEHVEKSAVLMTNEAALHSPNFRDYINYTIPANRLTNGRACRINTYSKWSPTVSTSEFYISVLLDGRVIYKSPDGQATGSSLDGGYRMQLFMTQTAGNQLFVQFDHYVTIEATATVGDMGMGSPGQSTTHIYSNRKSKSASESDPTVDRNIIVKKKWELLTGSPFCNKYYQTVEYL